MLENSREEVENLCIILRKFGSKVLRPSEDHVGKIYSNPYWHSIGDIVYNARDLVLIVGKKVPIWVGIPLKTPVDVSIDTPFGKFVADQMAPLSELLNGLTVGVRFFITWSGNKFTGSV